MRNFIISILSCILILVSTNSFARDKQPRRFNVDHEAEQTSSAPVTVKRKMSAEERLQRLERLINSQGLVDLLIKLEALQKEVQQLRGDVETQTHIANDLKKRQRDLYVDIDRRMLQLERNGSSSSRNSNSTRPTPSSSITTTPFSDSSPSSTKSPQTGLIQSPPVKQAKPVTTHAQSQSRSQSGAQSVDPIKEQSAYLKAFDLLRELRYAQAIKAYRKFILDYPNGRYAHIAQYWLSEASYAQRDFKQAITDYNTLVKNYPDSPKLAEAMLKIGYSYNELGNNKAAKEVIGKLLRVYPNTTAAGQGQNLLKKIKSAKR